MVMTKRVATLTAVLALLIVAGCGDLRLDRADAIGNPVEGYLKDPAAVVATVDWSQARRVDATVEGYQIGPARLNFQQGQPYRLRLENSSNYTCYFASENFFKNIAVQKLVTPTGVKTIPYYEEISLTPGEVKELFFVPVKDGTFEAECASIGHTVFGGGMTISVAHTAGYAMPVIAGGTLSSANPDEVTQTVRHIQSQSIRTANRAQLERIKADIVEFIRLIREREAELDAAGE
jgi:uncharacterized cupredoxin-like copper-binding protein